MQIAGSSRPHQLTPDMLTLAKQQVLADTKNKIQLNAMLAEVLLDSHFYNNATQNHSLIIASVGEVTVERPWCEEADILITQHAIALALLGKSVNVVRDDTDVFVLLVHFYKSLFKATP